MYLPLNSTLAPCSSITGKSHTPPNMYWLTEWQLHTLLPKCVFVAFYEKHEQNKWLLAPENPALWCNMSEAGIWQTAIGGLGLWTADRLLGDWGLGQGGCIVKAFDRYRQQVWAKNIHSLLCRVSCVTTTVSDMQVCFTVVICGLLVKLTWMTMSAVWLVSSLLH